MLNRVNKAAQPTVPRPAPRSPVKPQTGRSDASLSPDTLIESRTDFAGDEPGVDPYNCTGRWLVRP